MIGYAIDLSHYQHPDILPWSLYKGAVDLVMVRATYGSEYDDPAATEHAERAREIGAHVGFYHFFRPHQGWSAQAQAFERAILRAGFKVGDVVPAIDVEEDPLPSNIAVSSTWEPSVRQMVDAMRSSFGDCMVYITRADWHLLGSPQWVLERPLWVAEYTSAPKPTVPGDDVSIEPVMWQYRVGPFLRGGPGGVYSGQAVNVQVDQSRILLPIPLYGGGQWPPPSDPEATSPTDPPVA